MLFSIRKCLCVLVLGGCVAQAADFLSGQAARLVIGQETFTAQGVNQAYGAPLNSDVLVGAVGGLAYAGDTLFVTDANRVGAVPVNNRVLIYNRITGHQIPTLTQEIKQGKRCNVCVGRADFVLGQPDFTATDINLTQSGLRNPTAVASDGHVLVVADTDNNRVLIWLTIPTVNNAPADVVIGQVDFTHAVTSLPPTSKSMRGPQGVWIQNGKLYVADTQDNRVLVYNQIPTSNGVAADMVLGATNFTTFVESDIAQQNTGATASNMLNPVAVTSDGTRLFVTDLGYNRVLIWNTIPTANGAAADVAIGQPDLISSLPNNAFTGTPATGTTDTTDKETPVLCTVSNGTDGNSNPTYPVLCASTLSFPRFALSDGTHLFIADGGNDRVLVYNTIPTQSGASASAVLGQADFTSVVASDGPNYLISPLSLAVAGADLFVTDTYNRRILVFTPAEPKVPITAIRNGASREIFAVGTVTLSGTITAKDTITVTIAGKDYTYTIVATDTIVTILNALLQLINGGNGGTPDPNVIGLANVTFQQLQLTARAADVAGNSVTLASTTSSGATIIAATSGATLLGGQNSAQLGPGTIISIWGTNLAEKTVSAPSGVDVLPTDMGGVQLYLDGIRIPLFYVSPTQINAQIPFVVNDSEGVSVYVRTTFADGSVSVSAAVGVPIVAENPGVFAAEGADPRAAVMIHGSAYAAGLVSVDGTIVAGETGTITINSRTYSYTTLATDTLYTVRDALVRAINADPQVSASPSGSFSRIVLKSRVAGAAGSSIPFTTTVSGTNLLLTAIGLDGQLCCANQGFVTPANPAVPGEFVSIFAAGLGTLVDPVTGNTATNVVAGQKFAGGMYTPLDFVSSLAGGSTANVIGANLTKDMIGVYQVDLQLSSDIPTNPLTQITISQASFVSNVTTFPVLTPPLTITSPATLPKGTQNQVYSYQLLAIGGLTPYTWALTAGSTPGGTAIGSTGILSGTPTGSGSSFTATVTDSAGTKVSKMFSLTITPAAPTGGGAGAAAIGRNAGRANSKSRAARPRTAPVAQ
jgi:uncharacterized protein (TIGR03437 family)